MCYILENLYLVLQYYYEPRTGQQFRSLVAVERYLRDKKQDTPTPDTVKARNENTVSSKVALFSSYGYMNSVAERTLT